MSSESNYPKDFQEFLEKFKDEESCRNYLYGLRWPDGFSCPKCNNNVKHWLTAKNVIHCGVCGYQASLTAGTLFHGTRKPLLLWFHIMWWIVAQKTGVSASNMMDFMGFGSYKTVWTWLQKIRRAMVRKGRDRIFGTVEIDTIYIGGIDTKNKTIDNETRTLVAVATECMGKKIGRARFRCISDATSENMIKFIKENVKTGSIVITNELDIYKPFSQVKGYIHEIKQISRRETESKELLPHIQMIDSLLKRWLQGTHQGKVSPKYLPYYLDEFAFRFNKKISTSRGWLFYTLLKQAIELGPMDKKEIVGN